ncbi:MAG: DUF2202 domain-containing protein [Candidatus Nanopelagicales bacterium]|jgi:hypothetical protein|nr:DUF2202 domain-containing protein [Actinomycetota bacterium]HNE87981.1 DUF2202 domain-containing protein [Actinomycetota bacterium]HNL50767.1 DUF2202 domain-containing protein [Actinomycetota bacterium]HNO14637.1 DUF2202 domain-containing protein [Actinomycetota bacterium]HUM86870.1 DUF2202 domain-containing protein [Actinomycetota bacterium]
MKTRITVAAMTAAALVAIPTAAMAAPGGQGGPHGKGGAATQQRSGDCTRTEVSVGALTESQLATLKSMAEEEKLAHDVYVALDEKFGGVVFERIAASEAKHLNALRRVMARYNVADPTAGMADGEFASDSVKQLYDELLAKATTLEEAMAVGADIERMDIADLKDAIADATQRDLKRVYNNLLRGSQRHLVAFTR